MVKSSYLSQISLLTMLAVFAQLTQAQEEEFTDEDDVTLDEVLSTPPAVTAPADVPKTDETPSTTQTTSQEEEQEEDEEDEEDEEEVEQTAEEPSEIPPVTAAPEVDESTPMVASENTSQETPDGPKVRLFGSKRIQLSMNRPTFTEKGKLLEALYGKPRDYFTFGVDWFPLDWWVNPGLAFKLGGFSWAGKAAKAVDTTQPISEDNMTLDENSKTSLLFIPLQTAVKISMTPFKRKWIVFDGWFGFEYGWWQETRPETTSSITAWNMPSAAETPEPKPVLTSKGTSNSVVFGGSANILLNSLDERSARSMVGTMGLSYIYLTPFFESVKSMKTGGYTFGRNVYGVGFTFESYR